MTKKDYIVIAAAIRETRTVSDEQEHYVLDRVAARIADKLQSDNPRFDRKRFLEATR